MKTICGFRLGKTLGEGSFSKVKIATDMSTGKEYAIKIVKRNCVNEPGIESQIEKEVSILHTIKHPNVVRLHHVFRSKTKFYLVLDLADGGELFNKLADGGPLEENEARKYFQQLIDALDYIHKHHAVHRDLKPENLLLDRNGNLKVTDFGLSTTSLTSSEIFKTRCGTPNYVAPEIFSPDGYHGPPVDIWSAGLILYVMLTAMLPFDSDSVESVVEKVLEEPLQIPSYVPKGAADLIRKIVVRNPEERAKIQDIRDDPWFKIDYKQENGEISSNQIDEFKIVDAEIELISDQVCSDNPEITAFSLIAKVCRVDLRPLLQENTAPKIATSFSVSKPKEEIEENILIALRKLGGNSQKQKNGDIKAAFVVGETALSIRIEITHVVGVSHVVELYRLRGNSTDYVSLFNKIKNMI